MKTIVEHKYSIHDEVYHITPESPLGVILNMRWAQRSNEVEYLVTFGQSPDDTNWCLEDELTTEKRII